MNPRKRFSRTLSGDEPAAELDDDVQSVAERLKPQGNTLLGHPPTPAAGATAAGRPGPVLAPPKWRGAGAYRAGEEPQPQVSLIPAPPPMAAAGPSKPQGVPIGVMRSSVKTKMGQPPPPRPPEPAPANPPSEPPAAGDDTLKDTIQQMLEQQASVPIQVEEGIPELPVDELVDDEAPQGDARDEDDTQRPPPHAPEAEAEVVPAASAKAEEAAPIAAGSAGSAESEPTTAAPAPEPAAAPKPPEPAEPPPSGKRRERRPVASLTPIETPRSFLPRWNSEAGRGVLFVAAMVVIGGGGWLATRGGYYPRMKVIPPPAAVRQEAPPATAETTKPAEAAPETQTATTPAPAAPATPPSKETGAQRTARKSRAPSEPEKQEAKPSAEPAARAESAQPTGVLTVTPRAEEAAAELPESPTRENVIATLNGLRPAFLECAQGQRGVAQLDITLTDSGAVSHVLVGGDFAGSPQGSCIARAARNAQFAPFKKPRFRLVYPISL